VPFIGSRLAIVQRIVELLVIFYGRQWSVETPLVGTACAVLTGREIVIIE
jgi:hypothetical protein